MKNERKSEILKAAVSGMSATEIAAIEDLQGEQVEQVITEGGDEMAAIREHLQSMGWMED